MPCFKELLGCFQICFILLDLRKKTESKILMVWVLQVLYLKFIANLRERDDGNCKDRKVVCSVRLKMSQFLKGRKSVLLQKNDPCWKEEYIKTRRHLFHDILLKRSLVWQRAAEKLYKCCSGAAVNGLVGSGNREQAGKSRGQYILYLLHYVYKIS